MVYNAYIIVPLATWVIAQLAKFIIEAVRGRLDLRYLYASGGMPSVHSAVVCALATTALILAGAGSPEFGISVVLAAIVLYDSFGMRRAVGEQAVALNMVISSLNSGKVWVQKPETRLTEVLGHRPIEVLVGSLMGVVLAGLFSYHKLGYVGDFLQAMPAVKEIVVYAGIFAVILVLGVVQKLVLRARYRKSRTIKSLATRILVASVTISLVGGLMGVLEFEKASYAGWRLWLISLLVVAGFWAYSVIQYARSNVSSGLASESASVRKSRWLPSAKKKKKR